jgi:hypothetical protein
MINNLEYIKDSKGNIKSAVIRTSKGVDFSGLEELSKTLEHTIYLIPKDVIVEFNGNGWLVFASGVDTKNIWQFIKGWAMPYECFRNGFPFPVNMKEMWKSEKGIEEVSVEELRWNLKLPWWSTDEEIPYNLTPDDVLKDVNLFLDHKKRVENSDVKYPLLLVQTKQNRWLIYDGVHRFVRQILEGKQTVLCQKFGIDEMDKYIPDSHKELFVEWLDLEYQ